MDAKGMGDAATLLRTAGHMLFAVLLVVGTLRAAGSVGDGSGVPVVVSAAAVGSWYAVGAGWARWPLAVRVGWWWLGVLVVGWGVLVALSVDFVWLAFPLFLLCMLMLPRKVGPHAVVLLTAAAIVATALHQGLTVAGVLGPTIGAAVAIVIMIVYRQLRREVDLRSRLLADLTTAQDSLAAAQRRSGTLAERERLAGDIHDTVAQSLSTVILLLRSARGAWHEAPTPARRQLETALRAAQSALEDTRRLIHALTPAQLAGQPLTQALGQLTQAAGAFGLDARLTIDGTPGPLPTQVEVALLRTGQEALANVQTHARASQVGVTLTFLPDAVRLDIVDDGHGFDPERSASATTGTGLGLTTMRKRLADVGGALVVESAPGHGTAISAHVPRMETEAAA